MNALPENSSGERVLLNFQEGASKTRGPKGLYGGPLILQRKPFLPKAKLTAREGRDNRANAVIVWTVNLGIQRFCAPQFQRRL